MTKFAFVSAERGNHAVATLCRVIGASVSGFYFSHPDSTYFSVGRIGEDQVQDLARRRGADVVQMKRLLGSNLG